jgi:hypothetical protein
MLPNDYVTRHTLSANTLFILPSIDKAHAYPIVATKSCRTNRCEHYFKSHNGY